MKKRKTIKGGMFDGMTFAEAEAFVEKTLRSKPDKFKCVDGQWKLTDEYVAKALLEDCEAEGHSWSKVAPLS